MMKLSDETFIGDLKKKVLYITIFTGSKSKVRCDNDNLLKTVYQKVAG